MATYTEINDSRPIFKEEDGSPSLPVGTIKFPNNTLTDNGDGSFTYDPTDITLDDITVDTISAVSSEITFNDNILFEKTGTATGINDTYNSYYIQMKASVWDQTGDAHAEDRTAIIEMVGGSGVDGSEPYQIVFKDTDGNRAFTFDFTGRASLVVGKDWTGTYATLGALFTEDKEGGYIVRVRNKSDTATAYAGYQLYNDLNKSFEIGLGGGSRGDDWENVGWIWPGSSVDKLVIGVGNAERMALTSTGLRIQPNIAIADGASTILDVRATSPVTPPSLSAYNVANFVGPTGNHTSITLTSPNDKSCYIFMADTDAQGAGWFSYNHSNNTYSIACAGTNRMQISAGGAIVGPSVPEGPVYAFGVNGALALYERSSDPTQPAEGKAVIWMSDGTGKGDDGDVLIASTAGGVTKYAILFDHSAGTGW